MTTPHEGGVAAMDDTIAACRIALCRLDMDESAGDIRIGQGVIWALADLALGALAQAGLAESFLTGDAREAWSHAPVVLGEWRDQIHRDLEAMLANLSLEALGAESSD